MPNAVSGAPRLLLQLEGLAMLVASVAGYAQSNASWWLFGLLFLTPDLALLGYFAGARVGAAIYNSVHTYVSPALVVVVGLLLSEPLWPYALIWSAHIGMDRAVGLGLKYATGFKFTHLSQPAVA